MLVRYGTLHQEWRGPHLCLKCVGGKLRHISLRPRTSASPHVPRGQRGGQDDAWSVPAGDWSTEADCRRRQPQACGSVPEPCSSSWSRRGMSIASTQSFASTPRQGAASSVTGSTGKSIALTPRRKPRSCCSGPCGASRGAGRGGDGADRRHGLEGFGACRGKPGRVRGWVGRRRGLERCGGAAGQAGARAGMGGPAPWAGEVRRRGGAGPGMMVG